MLSRWWLSVLTVAYLGFLFATAFRDDQYFPVQGMYGSTWRKDVKHAGGGTLIEHSIHDIDVLQWLLGDPVSVRAHTASHFGNPGIEDTAAVMAIASPLVFLSAAILIFFRPTLGYCLGGIGGVVALPWFVLSESPAVPSVWTVLNGPDAFADIVRDFVAGQRHAAA